MQKTLSTYHNTAQVRGTYATREGSYTTVAYRALVRPRDTASAGQEKQPVAGDFIELSYASLPDRCAPYIGAYWSGGSWLRSRPKPLSPASTAGAVRPVAGVRHQPLRARLHTGRARRRSHDCSPPRTPALRSTLVVRRRWEWDEGAGRRDARIRSRLGRRTERTALLKNSSEHCLQPRSFDSQPFHARVESCHRLLHRLRSEEVCFFLPLVLAHQAGQVGNNAANPPPLCATSYPSPRITMELIRARPAAVTGALSTWPTADVQDPAGTP